MRQIVRTWRARTGTASTARAGCCSASEPNRFLVAEVGRPAAGPRARPRLRRRAGTRSGSPSRAGRSTGADFADVALDAGARARRRAWRRGRVARRPTCGNGSRPPRAFDLVVVLYLQLPAEELGPILGRAAAAVAPGGTLLVVGHHSRQPRARLRRPEGPARPLHARGRRRRRSTAWRSRRPRRCFARSRASATRSTRSCAPAAPARLRAGCRTRPRRGRRAGGRAGRRAARARRGEALLEDLADLGDVRPAGGLEPLAALLGQHRVRDARVALALALRTQPSRSRPSSSRVTPEGVSISRSARSTRRMSRLVGVGEVEERLVVVDRQPVLGDQAADSSRLRPSAPAEAVRRRLRRMFDRSILDYSCFSAIVVCVRK